MKILMTAAALALLVTPALAGEQGGQQGGEQGKADTAKMEKSAQKSAAGTQSVVATEAGTTEHAVLGTIKSVEAGMLTLENGSEYKLGEGIDLGDLGPGDRVKIGYDVVEDDYVATEIAEAEDLEAGEAMAEPVGEPAPSGGSTTD